MTKNNPLGVVKIFGIILFFQLFSLSVFSQSLINYKFCLHYASLWKHSEDIKYLPSISFKGFELSISKQTIGKKPWQTIYGYPTIGTTAIFLQTSDSIIGNTFLLAPFIELPLLRKGRHLVELKICTGVAYTAQVYDAESNTKNLLVSSKWCMSGIASLHYSYQVTSHLRVLVGANLLHASNGALKMPNYGINCGSLSSGLVYTPDFEKINFLSSDTEYIYPKKWSLYFNLGGGIKEIKPVYGENEKFTGKKYNVCHLSLDIGKRVCRKSILLTGIEGFYDESLLPRVRETEEREDVGKWASYRIGYMIGHELVLTKTIHVITQLGIYLHNPSRVNMSNYQRYGLRFFISKNFFISYCLKTHYGIADNWEFSTGIKI